MDETVFQQFSAKKVHMLGRMLSCSLNQLGLSMSAANLNSIKFKPHHFQDFINQILGPVRKIILSPTDSSTHLSTPIYGFIDSTAADLQDLQHW